MFNSVIAPAFALNYARMPLLCGKIQNSVDKIDLWVWGGDDDDPFTLR